MKPNWIQDDANSRNEYDQALTSALDRSAPFEDQEAILAIIEKTLLPRILNWTTSDNFGLYTIPATEVEMHELCRKGSCASSGSCYAEGLSFETCAVERVARIKPVCEEKPNYINSEIKKVDPDHLKGVLKDLRQKQEEDRRQMISDTNRALSDGFRCGLPANYNHAQRAIRDTTGKVIGYEPFSKSPSPKVEEETQEELWAKVINDTRWYTGSPDSLISITKHLMKNFTVKSK